MLKSSPINLNKDCAFNVQVIENLYTTCVQNRICKNKNEFYCYLCKFSFNELIIALKHIQHDKEHQERNKIGEINNEMLNNLNIDEIESVKIVLNGLIVINMQQFHCILCTTSMNCLKDVDTHINGKRHKNNKEVRLVSSNNSSLCSSVNSLNIVENVNILNDIKPVTVFKCSSCKMVLKNNAQYKYHKMFHLNPVRYTYCDIDIINFSLQVDKTKFIHCSICDHILSDEEELEKHLSDINHCNWLNFVQGSKIFTLSNDLAIHTIKFDTDYNIIDKTPTFTKFLYCQVCELSIPYSDDPKVFVLHENGSRHQKNLISPSIKNKQFESVSIHNNCVPVYICFICNIVFSDEKSLYIHYNEEIHQFRATVFYTLTNDKYLNIHLTDKGNTTIKCTMCNIEIFDLQNIIEHISGSKHKKKTKSQLSWSPDVISILPSDLKLYPFRCEICEVKVSYDFMLLEHLQSKNHKKRVNNYNESAYTISAQLFSCPICAEHFSTDSELIEHFQDLKHQECVKNKNENNLIDSINTTVEVSSSNCTLDLVNELHYSDDISDSGILNIVSDKDIDFETEGNQENLSSSLKKKRKRRIRRKNILRTSSLQNLAKIGEKYIELCIETGAKNIYNVDENKMRLGTTLSLPIDDDLRYCIPCNTKISNDLQLFCEHLRTEKHANKITEVVTSDKSHSTKLENYLSDFKLACSYMKKLSDDVVICLACTIKVKNFNTSIVYDHMNNKSHINNCKSLASLSDKMYQKVRKFMQPAWYFAEKFICEVCTVNCASEIDFVEHLTQDQHIEKAHQASIDGDVYEFDICVLCATYWYGKTDYYANHRNETFHKDLSESQDYVIPKLMKPVEQILNQYENTISSLLQECDKIDRIVEWGIMDLLEMILQSKYPNVNAHLFGSRLAGLNFDGSDLNIYLDCENTYCNFKTVEESQKQLIEIQKCLKEHEDTWTIEEMLLSEKVPIVKLRHRSTNRVCNVQCFNGLCVEKSKLIRYFVKAYPVCKKIILFLKKWLLLCGLSGQLSITNYALSVLVIFYLQINKILPSFSWLIQQKNQSNIVAGWETGFSVDNIDIPKEKYTIKDHLTQFFDYYAKFSYITDVICPFLGKPVQKRDFVNFDKLPENMSIYKSLYVSGNADIFRFDSPMCVQDPIELSDNLTKAVTKLQLRTFQQYCRESKTVMDKI